LVDTVFEEQVSDKSFIETCNFLRSHDTIQIKDSCSSDEESVAVPPNKTAIVCKFAQIPPEIWMSLPLEAKKWLLNERKRRKQEDEK
jgi:hypothetical protein